MSIRASRDRPHEFMHVLRSNQVTVNILYNVSQLIFGVEIPTRSSLLQFSQCRQSKQNSFVITGWLTVPFV